MSEFKILKLFCQNKDEFNKGGVYLHEIKNLERETKVLLNLITKYYSKYAVNSINKEELVAFYDMQYSSSRDREVYVEIINDIFRQDVSAEVLKDLLEQVIERHFAALIMQRVIPIVDGSAHGTLLNIQEDINKFLSLMRNPPQKEITPFNMSLQQLIDEEVNHEGLEWFIPSLNKIIGGLKRKTLGIIYAFVDTGKTSFGLAACAHFAKQLVGTNEKIIYAGNEESASRIDLRLTQSILGKTRREITTNIEIAHKDRLLGGYENILLFDSITRTEQLSQLLEDTSPRILFIDQGTKVVHGNTVDEGVREVQRLFNWYRESAKFYNTSIICLAQAVGEAENKKYLKLSDIYSSRVAIQGEVDYGIGIGRVLDDMAYSTVRFINVPKNKLHEGETGRFQTEFTRERCSWKEI
jgi:hypothetical protein